MTTCLYYVGQVYWFKLCVHVYVGQLANIPTATGFLVAGGGGRGGGGGENN